MIFDEIRAARQGEWRLPVLPKTEHGMRLEAVVSKWADRATVAFYLRDHNGRDAFVGNATVWNEAELNDEWLVTYGKQAIAAQLTALLGTVEVEYALYGVKPVAGV